MSFAIRTYSRTVITLLLGLVALQGINVALAEERDIGSHKQLPTIIYYPDSGDKSPAVLVLHTSVGLKKTVRQYGESLSDEGYVTYVPDFFSPYGMKSKTRRKTWTDYHDNLHDDFIAIIEAMKADSAVDTEKIFVVGFSNGGYWAALLAAEGEIAGGVSYYGALSSGGTHKNQDRLRKAFNKDSKPLLLLHGTDDEVVKVSHANLTEQIAKDAGVSVSVHIFDGAEHSYNVRKKLNSSSANRYATEESWKLTLEFLEENMQ